MEAFGQLGEPSQHAAFRGGSGAAMDGATRMGQLVAKEFKKVLEEAGMPAAELGCNTLRHMCANFSPSRA